MKVPRPGRARARTAIASEETADAPEPAQNTRVPTRGITRRAIEKLGQRMSNRPPPEVHVTERAGKTAMRLHGLTGALGRPVRAGIYAAIDLGSSSAKMLLMRVGADGSIKVLLDLKIGTALGQGVGVGEDIPAENQQRTLDALQTFIEEARRIGGVDAADIPVVATAVVRNAGNGAHFLHEVQALGLTRARALSGHEEAALGFAGALAMMKGAPGAYATLDLGGGSFQLAIGSEQGMSEGGSTQVGSNAILELLAAQALTTGEGTDADLDAIDQALETLAPMPLETESLRGRTLVATGGVAKFLRAHFGKDVIAAKDVDALRRQVITLPYTSRVELVVGSKSEDTTLALGIDTHEGALAYGQKLPASASLLLHILRSLGVDEVRVSETDARHALLHARMTERP